MIENVLIKTTPATAMDCSHIENITGIEIDSAEPEGTQTRYLLKVNDGKWRKYTGSAWTFADVQDLTADSVLDEGNTKSELMTLTENALNTFAGKIIDVAVAMSVENNAEMPSVTKFEMLGQNSQIKKDFIYSDVIKLGEEVVGINEIDVAKTESSGCNVEIYVSTQSESGEWSDYVPYHKVADKAKAIRLKAELEVDKPNISTAILDNVKIRHWQNGKAAPIEGKSVLITKPITLDGNANRVHALLRHPKISDTEFKVYVLFGDAENFVEVPRVSTYNRSNEIEDDFEYIASSAPTSNVVTPKVEILQKSGTVENEVLGTGIGKQQAFKLAHHARPETLKVTGSDNWTFREKTDTLLITARADTEISVSYDWIAPTTYLTALACVFNS